MERNQRWHMPDPQYKFSLDDTGDNRICTVTVIGVDGRPASFAASATIPGSHAAHSHSEKHQAVREAKTLAAGAAVAALIFQERPPEPTP
jgi:hypothetical protein